MKGWMGMLIKRSLATTLVLAVLVGGGAFASGANRTQATATGAGTVRASRDAVIDKELTQPVTSNWADVGGNLTNERYSSLNQITTANVAKLKPVFQTSLVTGPTSKKYWTKYNQEATPLEQGGVLYIPTGNDDVFALNAVTGAKLWTYHSNIDQANTTVCCQWDNRGVALGQGMVFDSLLDGGIVALSQKTGKVVWKNHLVRWQDGYGITAAPLYYNGAIYIGTTGGEFGARGRLYALNAMTGKEMWRFYTIPGPNDAGGKTWPNNGSYRTGGAPIWNTPAVDPKLGLLYFSTGNAAPDLYGGNRKGDNLYSSSIVALHMNGKIAWHFQEVHHDIWDFDAPSPVVLYAVMMKGQMRQGIGQVGKTGWFYLLDRATGKPLVGITEKAVPQNADQATSPTQPYPAGDAVIPQCAQTIKGFQSACIFTPVAKVDQVFAPLFNGGVDASPSSFSPQTGYLYTGADIQPFDATYAKEAQPKKGQFWIGFGGSNTLVGAVNSGTFTAIDARTNKIAWQVKLRDEDGSGSGAMTTAGGLVFNGQIDGVFKAYDAKTGKAVWQWRTGLPNNAPSTTYEVNGTQYVAIDTGGNGYLPGAQGPADALWVFTLKGSMHGAPIPQAQARPPIDNVTKLSGAAVHTGKVAIFDYGYKPAGAKGAGFGSLVITVPVGTKVTWINTGSQPHTSTSTDGKWDTGIIPPGGSATVTMNKVGTFHYDCTPHPWMLGEVIVTPI